MGTFFWGRNVSYWIDLDLESLLEHAAGLVVGSQHSAYEDCS